MKKLVFIKFGGSAITDKTKPLTVNKNAIRRAAEEMQEVWRHKDKDTTVVIGNGAGSFGHYAAQQYGTKTEEAIQAIHQSVVELNHHLVSQLADRGLPVVSFAAGSLFQVENGQVTNTTASSFIEVLNEGKIPSVYGDILKDTNGEGIIFSTERIFRELINPLKERFQILRVVHVGTVPGVLDADQNVIPSITSHTWSEVQQHIYAPKGFDVTGGMKHKIEESLELAQQGIESVLCNLEDTGTVSEAALGNASINGTRILV